MFVNLHLDCKVFLFPNLFLEKNNFISFQNKKDW
jgi:hypothetical protein